MKELYRLARLMACVGVLMFGCSSRPQWGPDRRAADEVTIRRIDIEWSKAGAAGDLDGMMSNYAKDATLMLPNMPKARGTEAIRGALGPLFDAPGFSLKWQPAEVEVARSGDIAYVYGNYELTMNDPKGNPTTDYGSYVEVWKKRADGKWKCIVDIINSDVPLPAGK